MEADGGQTMMGRLMKEGERFVGYMMWMMFLNMMKSINNHIVFYYSLYNESKSIYVNI